MQRDTLDSIDQKCNSSRGKTEEKKETTYEKRSSITKYIYGAIVIQHPIFMIAARYDKLDGSIGSMTEAATLIGISTIATAGILDYLRQQYLECYQKNPHPKSKS